MASANMPSGAPQVRPRASVELQEWPRSLDSRTSSLGGESEAAVLERRCSAASSCEARAPHQSGTCDSSQVIPLSFVKMLQACSSFPPATPPGHFTHNPYSLEIQPEDSQVLRACQSYPPAHRELPYCHNPYASETSPIGDPIVSPARGPEAASTSARASASEPTLGVGVHPSVVPGSSQKKRRAALRAAGVEGSRKPTTLETSTAARAQLCTVGSSCSLSATSSTCCFEDAAHLDELRRALQSTTQALVEVAARLRDQALVMPEAVPQKYTPQKPPTAPAQPLAASAASFQPLRTTSHPNRPDYSRILCRDYVKGTCDQRRWKCKYWHPPLPLQNVTPVVAPAGPTAPAPRGGPCCGAPTSA